MAEETDHGALVKAAAMKAGGASALAAELGIKPSAVSNWRLTGIPAARVPAVAQITGLSFHELRPDVFPPPAPTSEREVA